jgi:ketosteroid isomerase-like protein
MSDAIRQPVMDANRAFYRAFAQRDLPTMENLWAHNSPVACIHPGWAPIFGREAVVGSWRGILANPSQGTIVCSDERVLVSGDTAIVICQESMAGSLMVATNIFLREDGTWRMIHHQAGPMPPAGERGSKGTSQPSSNDKRTLH